VFSVVVTVEFGDFDVLILLVVGVVFTVDFCCVDVLILVVVGVVASFGVEFRLAWFELADCKLSCVEFVEAADAAPHIVILNTRQNIRKPNLF
jgi:hypothetical protein